MQDRFLTRREASQYLIAKGLPVAATTLAKYVTVGGGPAFVKWGRSARYRTADLDTWIAEKLTPSRRNSSGGV